MMVNILDKLGEWNPQMFRELKGRLKSFNVVIAVASSLLLQLVVFLYQLREFPGEKYSLSNAYCNLSKAFFEQQNNLYRQQEILNSKLSKLQQIKSTSPQIITGIKGDLKLINKQLTNLSNSFCPPNEINWSLWWRDHWEYIFLSFSVIFVFTLLVAGTYLLISDLAKEDSRGTLNFIRLSPQSATSILRGKLLGVPSLVYLFVFTALPLHFWAGRAAKIATSYILSYYAILIASCIFFFSAALLFGLVSRWFSSFQPWLGSGLVLLFLFMTMMIASSSGETFDNPLSWLRLFSPWDITNYLFINLFRTYKRVSPLENLQFFYFPVGKYIATTVGLYLVNYGVLTYGIWLALERCFHNPNSTVISKGQSYFLVAFCQFMLLGLMMQNYEVVRSYENNLYSLIMLNLAIIFALIFLLSPQRQTIQDWARYRHINVGNQGEKPTSILDDLTWGEKSPALLAIAINLLISATPIVVWISLAYDGLAFAKFGKDKAFLSVFLSISLMLIYATIAQLMLLIKNRKRYFWAIGTLSTAISLPPMILAFLGVSPANNSLVWLFSSFPWAALEYSEMTTILIAFLSQLGVLAVLNFQLTRKVKILGESATKALLAGR
jgi:hypothetical protein